MKELIIFLLFPLFPLCCSAQISEIYKSPLMANVKQSSRHVEKNDLDHENLKGAVKSVTSFTYFYTDKKGHFNADSNILVITWQFNQQGNMIEFSRYSILSPEKKSPTQKSLSVYDAQGYLKETRDYSGESLTSIFKLKYDLKENKIIEEEYGPDSNDSIKIPLSYDSLLYDSFGRLLQQRSSWGAKKISYGNNGSRSEPLDYQNEVLNYDTLAFDSCGRMIWYGSYSKNKLSSSQKRKYDNKGNEIAESRYSYPNKVFHNTMKYKFDSKGNWIKQITLPCVKDGSFNTREIEYY